MSIKKRVESLVSGPLFQSAWESLFKLARHRMNYGRGGTVRGSGEIRLLSFIAERLLLDDPVTVFDVGACVGEYAGYVRSIMKDRAIIYCFEPNKISFSALSEAFEEDKRVHCFCCGIGDQETETILYSKIDNPFHASMYQGNAVNEQSISVTTIDRFCKSNDIDRIDLLKMDIEGHELKALLGASSMLNAGKVRFIQFEFGDCNVNSRTFFRDFFDLLSPSYLIYRILHHGLYPIEHYDEAHEVFKVTNYLAILKTISKQQ